MEVVSVSSNVKHRGEVVKAGTPFNVTQEEGRRYLAAGVPIQPVEAYDPAFLAEQRGREVPVAPVPTYTEKMKLEDLFAAATAPVTVPAQTVVLDDAAGAGESTRTAKADKK